jgi:hypothetical protein
VPEGPHAEAAPQPAWPERRFWLLAGALAVGAFALRALYGHLAGLPRGTGDDLWYHWVALRIADGQGFTVGLGPGVNIQGAGVVTAGHPPLFPALLAVASKLGLRSYHEHLLVGCAFGAGTVVAIAAIGRRLAGPAIGIAAAALAAIYLPLIANDSMLMSESLYGLMIALTILAALRFLERPGAGRGVLVGAAIGFAALTRSEALLLILLLVPFLLRRVDSGRLRSGTVIVVAAVVVVVPWCIRNTAVFDRPTTITTGDGGVIAGANLHSTYYGRLLGGWDLAGLAPAPRLAPGPYNEAAAGERLRSRGIAYARRHAGRVPVVAAVRILRTWGLYPFSPREQVAFWVFTANHVQRLEWATLISHWLAMLLAIPGILWMRARRMPLAPLLAPLVLVTVVSMLFFGDFRFRQTANPSLVILATLGLAAARVKVSEARARRSDKAAPPAGSSSARSRRAGALH